ncbi:MAG: hypothetical protein II579_01780, partial [Treponema sp.]|nr:hypothetical protein [Treponema sp.]
MSFSGLTRESSGRYLYPLYHLIPWLIRPSMPLRHGLSRVPPFGSIPTGTAAPPLQSRVGFSPSVTLRG